MRTQSVMMAPEQQEMDNEQKDPEREEQKDLERKEQDPDIKVAVRNFCLVKHIVDGDDGVALVGTLIQTIPDPVECFKEKDFFFDYRFNDLSQNEQMIQVRKTEQEKRTRTFQINIPLVLDVKLDAFPFKVVTASLTMDLSTTEIEKKRYRPNIQVAAETNHFNENVALQRSTKRGGKKIDEKKDIKDLFNKIDKMEMYDPITPFPRVEYFYNNEKEYCSKSTMTFYFIEEGVSKVFEIMAPMLLVATLNTLSVDNDQKVDNVDYIANAATFALTTVFILPNIKGRSNKIDILTANNLYIFLVFIGLALSSIPEDMAGTKSYAYAGMSIFWVSFLVPIGNAFRYLYFKKTSIRVNDTSQIHNFIKPKKVKGEPEVKPEFKLVGKILEKIETDEGYQMKKEEDDEDWFYFSCIWGHLKKVARICNKVKEVEEEEGKFKMIEYRTKSKESLISSLLGKFCNKLKLRNGTK